MKLTNNLGLPAALIKALENDPYDAGDSDYTATSLLKPVQMKALAERYHDQLTEDAEDGIYRLYGQVAHGILERANMADLAEKRFFMEVSGKKVSAQIDTLCLVDGTLSDFKMTTSWGFKKSSPPKADWIAQLNIQRYLLKLHGYTINKLQIIGLLRDWQIRESKTNPDYPDAPIVILDIPIWSDEQTLSFMEMRIAEHEAAKFIPDEMLTECTFEERFAGKESWAVVKRGKGGKARAIAGGVQFSEEAAQSLCEKNPGTYVEYRREDPLKRCQNYCNVSQFCAQYKRLTAIKQTGEEEKDAV